MKKDTDIIFVIFGMALSVAILVFVVIKESLYSNVTLPPGLYVKERKNPFSTKYDYVEILDQKQGWVRFRYVENKKSKLVPYEFILETKSLVFEDYKKIPSFKAP